MKKVLALVLAVMMMATVAFAATYADTIGNGSSSGRAKDLTPGSKIKIVRDSGNNAVFSKNPVPTNLVDYDDTTAKVAKDINTENYSVTGIKYNEGKSLISRIYIDDKNDELVIQMADDYTNTKDKSFDVEFTLKGKGKYTSTVTGKKVSTPDVDFRIGGKVGYDKVYLGIFNTDDDLDAYNDLQATDAKSDTTNLSSITTSNIGDYVIEVQDKGGAYATMTQDIADDEVSLEVRVYDGNSFNLGYNTDVNTDIVKANADAEMSFYEWDAAPTFDATAKIYFNDADEDHFVYQIKNGKVTEVGKYDEDEGCWVVKARTLGAYVVSDTKLASATSASDSTGNPDTGANDVVGIATALAAVALVSAAAVSLKK